MYNALLTLQNGVCAVCGRPPKDGGMNLVVDHYHFKIIAEKIPDGNWYAFTDIQGLRVDSVQRSKKDAIQVTRDRALPLSVRGLLCPGRHGRAGHGACNRLIGRVDNVDWLKKVIAYLANPPAKLVLDKRTK